MSYYVTANDGRRSAFLLGPFSTDYGPFELWTPERVEAALESAGVDTVTDDSLWDYYEG